LVERTNPQARPVQKIEAFQEGREKLLLGGKVELGIELLPVGLHRRRRDGEVIADRFAGMAFQDEKGDLAFARAEQVAAEVGEQVIDGAPPGMRLAT
jgi:hypothetical protein